MKNSRICKAISIAAVLAMLMTELGACGMSQEKADNTQKGEAKSSKLAKFATSLDTDKATTLEIAGYMGNFEALDQVINDFNEYYPNVTVTYEQNNAGELAEYLKNNQYCDIFMTNMANIHDKNSTSSYAGDYCLDLSQENLDTDAIEPEMLKSYTVDGKLMSIPIARNMCGIVVNKTLLEKEGLDIPQTYPEFINACKILKEKGYTPIQASKIHASSDLVLPMAMCMIANDSSLLSKINASDPSAADSLTEVYEKLNDLYAEGYMDASLNAEYPDDNYDGAILKFFEGDVPFWVCTTECVSGMKKRESKSEAFSANPFEYTFIDAPLSDDGAYVYEEPWYGFAVNRESDNIDYAVEFMQFLMTEDELNTIASVKGMPSAAKKSTDERYKDALDPEKTAATYIYDGNMKTGVTSAIADVANELGNGDLEDLDAAIEELRNRISQL